MLLGARSRSPEEKQKGTKRVWKRRVSIPVPRACEARALPIELRSRHVLKGAPSYPSPDTSSASPFCDTGLLLLLAIFFWPCSSTRQATARDTSRFPPLLSQQRSAQHRLRGYRAKKTHIRIWCHSARFSRQFSLPNLWRRGRKRGQPLHAWFGLSCIRVKQHPLSESL